MRNNSGNGSGNGKEDEHTEPDIDILMKIYEELFRQSKLLDNFDKKLRSMEDSINIVMNSYTSHTERLSSIEATCESRGKLLSRLTLATPIPSDK